MQFYLTYHEKNESEYNYNESHLAPLNQIGANSLNY